MKKIKFMMPALAIASTAAAITPMVTSCKNASKGLMSFQVVKKGDIVSKCDCKYKPLDKQKFKDQIALANAYADTINGNPEIFSDDFIKTYWMWMQATSESNAGFPVDEETITVSNGHITNKWTTYDSELDMPVTTSLVSYDLNIESIVDNASAPKDYLGKWSLNYHVQNSPFTMYFKGRTSTPMLLPTLDTFIDDVTDAQCGLTILASKMTVDFSMSVKDLKDDTIVYTQLDTSFSALDLVTLIVLLIPHMSNDTNAPTLLSMLLQPLTVPVISNYFSKAIKG